MLGPILLTVHNLTYYQRLMRDARAAIAEDRFLAFYEAKRAPWAAEPAGDSCRE
jgi:queuine tRNA-ribosyltransferase